jgi:hypothetical protein
MENPTLVKPIDSKLVLSSASNVPYGSGIKTFQVNPNPMNDIQTQNGNVQSTGAKYITSSTNTVYGNGALPYITSAAATFWRCFASAAGITNTISIVGVNELNAEVSENVVLNGTANVLTVNKYKCVNDAKFVAGGLLAAGATVTIQPQGFATLHDLQLTLSRTTVVNPWFMVGSKNGVTRRARLRSVNFIYNTTATSNIACHVLANDVIQPGTTAPPLGLPTVAHRIIEIPVNGVYGITYPEDGIIDIGPGEMAVWFRESGSTVATYMSATWTYYNV